MRKIEMCEYWKGVRPCLGREWCKLKECPKNTNDKCEIIPTPKPSKAEVMDKATTTELLSLNHRATMYAQIINEIQGKAEVMERAAKMMIAHHWDDKKWPSCSSICKGKKCVNDECISRVLAHFLKLAQDEIGGRKK